MIYTTGRCEYNKLLVLSIADGEGMLLDWCREAQRIPIDEQLFYEHKFTFYFGKQIIAGKNYAKIEIFPRH
jgi:hypothetical protein